MVRRKGVKFLKDRLGAFPSPWDYRHYRVLQASPKEVVELPKEYYKELLKYAKTDPWPDQGDVGSCCGWCGDQVDSISSTLLKLYAKRTNQPELLKYVIIDLSAGWLYHWSREYANIPPDVEGSTNLGLMKAMKHKGAALEKDVPTDTKKPWDGITYTKEAEERAKQYAINSYWNINPNPNDIKAAIYGLTHELPYKMPDGSQGKIPLVSSYQVYQSYTEAYDDGIVPMPKENDKLLGGHSSAIIGWKVIDGEEYFVNMNSWGSEIGDGGLFYLPVKYPFYPYDFWLIHNGPPVPSPSPCAIGNGVADFLNKMSGMLGRRGRFRYVNEVK